MLPFDTRTQADEVRTRTGALLWHSGIYEQASAWDSLEFYARVRRLPKVARQACIKELLCRMGLWERRREPLGKWGQVYDRANLDSAEAFVAFHKRALQESLSRWHAVFDAAYRTLPLIDEDRQAFFVDHCLVQLETIIGLHTWCYHLCLAVEAQEKGVHRDPIAKQLRLAIYAMEKLLLDRQKAEHGKWRHWYRGDKKMNLPAVLARTRALTQGTADTS